MSFDVNWDIDSYREEYESEDHWELRRAFMEKWKNDYPEDRLVCLARVFVNVELLGCRYHKDVMQEIATMSYEVAQAYRSSRKNKLKRTFVSASDAAEDRARGRKREGGVVTEPSNASKKMAFVPAGHDNGDENGNEDCEPGNKEDTNEPDPESVEEVKTSETLDVNNYLEEMSKINCLDIRYFNERMFQSRFGRFVLLIRPWTSKYSNIQSSCQSCHLTLTNTYENGCCSLSINGQLIAQATAASKVEAKAVIEEMVWNRLKAESVSVVVKQQWIAHGDARITVGEVSGRKSDEIGTPLENSVALKMMKMMGWKGGGLGADAQGISEPIKPNLRMVNRSGLGSVSDDVTQLRRAAHALMRRYIAADTFDLDLVFSSEFSKEERAALHQLAQRAGLASRSYGTSDRFLVVKKKLDPFSLVRAVIEKGGNTPKYQVFLPAALRNNR